MNHVPRRLLSRAVIGLVVLLNGCASTRMQSVERAPDFQSERIRKVLVVSLSSTPEIRQMVEDEFVHQWKDRGVQAEASYVVLPTGTTLDKAGVAPVAKARGYDSVLVNRLMSRQAIDREVRVHKIGESGPPEDSQNMSGYLNAVVASPQYPIDYSVAVLSSNLYDVATEKKIWSGVSQTLVAGDIPDRIGPFTKVILKTLYQTH